MPLTLVTGRANSGKTGVIHGAVRAAAREGLLPVLVLPGTADARLAREEFASAGPVMGVRLVTFDELLHDLWSRFGDGRAIVTEAQRRSLIRRALGEAKLAALKESATRPGLLDLLESLARLVSCNADPELLRRAGPGGEILRVLDGYLRLLERDGLAEEAQAARLLSDDPRADWFEGPIGVNRFSDLTLAQERLFCAVAAVGVDVRVALPWDEGFPATRALDALVGRLVADGATVEKVAESSRTVSPEIAYLESRLFRDPAMAIGATPTGDIRLSEACGEEAEADRIASEVLFALAEGVEPARVGVVFRDPARHASAIRRAFSEAGIAASFDVLVSAGSTGLGRAVSHLFAYAGGGSRTALVAFMRTPYSGTAASTSERLERRWRQHRVTDVRALDADLGRGAPAAARLVGSARQIERTRLTPETGKLWEALTAALLRNAYAGRAACLDDRGRTDAATQRALMRTIEALSSLGSPTSSVRDVLDGMDSSKIPLDAEEVRERVQVLSAHRARSRRFDVLIVGGMTDGDFPAPARENALSPASVAGTLEEAGLSARRADEQDAERLLFYLTVTRATRRLVLSRQVADSEGRPLRPSWLLDELLDLYRVPGEPEPVPESLPPVASLGFEDSGLAPGAPGTPRRALRSAALAGAEGAGEAGARLADARRRASGRSPGLSEPAALEYLARERTYSATEIEAYLACPYAWFHSRVVRPERIDTRIDALAQGTLMHDALHAVFERLPVRTGAARVTPETVDEALRVAAEALDEVIAGFAEPATFSEEAALIAVRRQVMGFVRADAEFLPEFAPVALEYGFGKDEPVDFGGFGLTGRIDRIDANADGLLVVTDYKKKSSIDAAFGLANLMCNGKVQIALYARVAESRFGRPVAGAFYRGVSGRNLTDKRSRGFYRDDAVCGPGLVRTDRVSADALDELLDEAGALAREAVLGMRAGDISARPRTKGACDYCGLRLMCPGRAS